jgi:serine/threonine protein kinase
MVAMTLVFAVYIVLSHKYLASLSGTPKRHLSYESTFHQAIPDFLKFSTRMVAPEYLPKRPRSIGFYFEATNSDSYIGTEQTDPNVMRLFYSHAMPDVTPEQIEQQEALQDSKKYRHGMADQFEDGDCVAQHDWQKSSYPTCNLLMEQDLTALALDAQGKSSVRLLAAGYWRDVWKARDPYNLAVVKTMRYEHAFEPRNYDRHRRDAVAMERLTSSEWVMEIYSFCGNSGMFEFADGGSIEDSIFYSKGNKWNSTERLVVAYQVASGLADLHNFEKEGRASIAHTDVTTSQFVYVGEAGIYKLNDFNRCRFIRWNKKKDEPCSYHVGNNPGTVRSLSAICGIFVIKSHRRVFSFSSVLQKSMRTSPNLRKLISTLWGTSSTQF